MKTSLKFTQTRITTTTVLIKLIWPCHDWKKKFSGRPPQGLRFGFRPVHVECLMG